MELVTDRARNLGDRRDAFEQMRDAVAEQYRAETGEVWRPRQGSHASQTGKLTSAAIDARDFIRARKDRATMAHLPQGTLVAIAGGKDVADPAAVIRMLDKTRTKHGDMVLVHGGGPGVEKIAARWAERNGIDQVVCKPDWDRHGRARPVPPQRRAAQPPAEGASSPSPAPASPTTSSTRPDSSASPSAARLRSLVAGRAVIPGNGRWRRGPFSHALIGGASTPSSRALRATLAIGIADRRCDRMPVQFPVAPAATIARFPAAPLTALPPIFVTALPTSPPSSYPTLHRMAVSAPAATQSPWRLRSAALTGEDSPMKIAARFWPFGPRSGCLVTPDSPLVNWAHA